MSAFDDDWILDDESDDAWWPWSETWIMRKRPTMKYGHVTKKGSHARKNQQRGS